MGIAPLPFHYGMAGNTISNKTRRRIVPEFTNIADKFRKVCKRTCYYASKPKLEPIKTPTDPESSNTLMFAHVYQPKQLPLFTRPQPRDTEVLSVIGSQLTLFYIS